MNLSKSIFSLFVGILISSSSWAGGKPIVTLSASSVPAEGRLFTDADPLTVCIENLTSRMVNAELGATAPGAPLHTEYIYSFIANNDAQFITYNLTESLFWVRIIDGKACSQMTGLVLPGTYFNINHIRLDSGRMRESVNYKIMGLTQ